MKTSSHESDRFAEESDHRQDDILLFKGPQTVIESLKTRLQSLEEDVDDLTKAVVVRDAYITQLERKVEDLGVERDSVEIEGIQNTIEQRKRSDRHPLTGLYNIDAFEREVNERLTRINPHGANEHTGVMFFIDLDHLNIWNEILNEKRVNETILKPLAEELQDQTRSHDVLGHWGGDEFALFAPGMSVNAAYEFAARVRKRINLIKVETTKEGPQFIGVTTGFTVVESGDTCSEVTERAAMAKRYAKDELDRNEIVNFDDIPDAYDFGALTKKARASLEKSRTAQEELSALS